MLRDHQHVIMKVGAPKAAMTYPSPDISPVETPLLQIAFLDICFNRPSLSERQAVLRLMCLTFWHRGRSRHWIWCKHEPFYFHFPRRGRCEFSICLQGCNRIIRLCIYKRSKKQIPVLNGPFHSAVIRSYATRQPAIFTCAVLEQASVIKRSDVVQMEANNNRPGHSVQKQRRFTATQLQFCIRGNHKKINK